MINNTRSEKALGYQQIGPGIAAATGFTIPAGTSRARVIVEAQAVRYRDDGTAPTSTVGMPLPVGSVTDFDIQQLGQVRFIEQTAGATLNISYYGL